MKMIEGCLNRHYIKIAETMINPAMLSLVDTFQAMIGRHFGGQNLHWGGKGGAIMEEQFGNRLMYLRKGKGLSQEELGNQIGVSRQTVSKWELNQTTPEMDKLVLLGNLFHISLDELVGREYASAENSIYEELSAKMDTIISTRDSHHYEYKSNKMIGNLPLVHINIGRGIYKSKGIISIGVISSGIISIGFLSLGVVSIGVLALGILTLAVFAAGLVAAGSVSLGLLALGAVSIGYLSIGAVARGVYAIGASASAVKIALGDVANGHIAIGKTTAHGAVEFLTRNHVPMTDIRAAILKEYPGTWEWLIRLFSSLGNGL